MRLLFMGTPGFAVPTLRKLLSSRHRVSGVFTQPDRPSGRGRQLAIGPVKQLALDSGLPVYQPERLAQEEWKPLVETTADALVVVAYGKILPSWLFTLPSFGAINVHASLLPSYRGRRTRSLGDCPRRDPHRSHHHEDRPGHGYRRPAPAESGGHWPGGDGRGTAGQAVGPGGRNCWRKPWTCWRRVGSGPGRRILNSPPMLRC